MMERGIVVNKKITTVEAVEQTVFGTVGDEGASGVRQALRSRFLEGFVEVSQHINSKLSKSEDAAACPLRTLCRRGQEEVRISPPIPQWNSDSYCRSICVDELAEKTWRICDFLYQSFLGS